jgi:hypothetical protein
VSPEDYWTLPLFRARLAKMEFVRGRLESDLEMLVCRAGKLQHLQPLCLAEFPSLKSVLPAKGKVRRNSIDNYAELHAVKTATLPHMDAMIATLEFVATPISRQSCLKQSVTTT